MSEIKIMNVLTMAETVAQAQSLVDLFSRVTGTQSTKLTFEQATAIAGALKKQGLQLAYSVVPSQFG